MSLAVSATAQSHYWATTLRLLFLSLRPRQWTKNLVLFAGLVFAGELRDPSRFATASAAFAVFCALSGGVYLMNDLVDRQRDRQHPLKRFRPLASGLLSSHIAAGTCCLLLVGAFAGALLLGYAFALIALAYLAVQLLYSFHLKHVVLLDMLAVASGFVLRAVAGAEAVRVEISPWLYIVTVLLALFLALGKQRHELALLQNGQKNTRPILEQYSLAFLDQLIMVMVAALLVSYCLYTFFATSLPSDHSMMLTIPLVLYGLLRYLWLIYVKGDGEAPDVLLTSDRPLAISVVLWGLTAIFVLYLLPR